MRSREEHWRELEQRLSSLIDFLESQIDRRYLDELRHFVEHREFGVALEELTGLVAGRAILLRPEQDQEIERLAIVMRLDLDKLRGSHSA